MRRLTPALSAVATLALASCGPTPAPVVQVPVAPVVAERGELIGMDANELATRLGQPRLQIREGDGIKLQFASSACVLDAYLYPPVTGGGVARVTHIDTRSRSGGAVDQTSCVGALEAR